MACYQKNNLDIFMSKVEDVNSHFERVKTSSLRPLITILNDTKGTAQLTAQALRKLPVVKQQKYWKALLYLRETYPQLPLVPLQGGSKLGKLNAATFVQNPVLPTTWDEDFSGQQGANKLMKKDGLGEKAPYLYQREIGSKSNAFLNKSLEHYIVENPTTVAGVLIHMESHVDALNHNIEGVSHCDHLISVIKALANVGAPLCVLLQKKDVVCGQLQTAVGQCTTTTVKEGTGHMGGKNVKFQEFVNSRPTMIMMGYDGDVCVGANSFGTGETMPLNGKLVVPVISQANIVTSRAVLVTRGLLNKVDKWGVLSKT